MTKRIAITGASSGIGMQSALMLAERGYELVLFARREDLLVGVAAQCLELGSPLAIPVPGDVQDPVAVQRLALALESSSNPVLVNNAGWAQFGKLDELDFGKHSGQIETNLIGLMRVTAAVLPNMKRVGGQIVNVLSISSTNAFAEAAAYCASKAGALMFARCLSKELRDYPIRISSILPGSVDTELWDNKDWSPEKPDMLTALSVAEAIRDLIELPADRRIDELELLPPRGIL